MVSPMSILSHELSTNVAKPGLDYQQALTLRYLAMAGFPPFDERMARNENGKVGGKCTYEQIAGLGGSLKEIV
jgi:hypothetical protein